MDQTKTDVAGAPIGHPLLELAAKCEGAAGADREVDAILATIREPSFLIHPKSGTSEQYAGWIISGDGFEGPSMEYTASLDAAMRLIREDHTVYLTRPSQTQVYPSQNNSYACVAPKGLGGPQFAKKRAHLSSYAKTPALALCAAALKARAAADR